MQRLLLSVFCIMLAISASALRNPKVVADMLNRIGGNGAAERFETEVDAALAGDDAKEVFVIGAEHGKPKISGSSILALTTGINWYLNHYAHIQLTWHNMKVNLTKASLPVPQKEERHVSTADYRYYLNYCTFSYSMAFWSWERWQQEIDWMALHGINMPLAIVGAEVVWQKVLQSLGYNEEEINQFVAGPAFMAWFMMGNLEGWGGPNRPWWYARQERLGKQILEREREFGMEPVLPGYSGMVPHDYFERMGLPKQKSGQWHRFQRPGLLVPTDSKFAEMAALYYEKLAEVMGTSGYYSMDLFHEGGSTDGIDLKAAFAGAYHAMQKAVPGSKWVIQAWGDNPRHECLESVPKGGLIVLDLFSDGRPNWQSGYEGHEFVYCMLNNFGGRNGIHGRLDSTITRYYNALAQYPQTCKGVGATPEGIETNPVLYEALFELPWTKVQSPSDWTDEMVLSRYGMTNDTLREAWQLLRKGPLHCKTSQQGPSEAILCARPGLEVKSVSTWGTGEQYYEVRHVRRAAALLLSQRQKLADNANYRYDVVDLVRQSLVNDMGTLLEMANAYYSTPVGDDFRSTAKRFLDYFDDINTLLNSHPAFMLGTWTGSARSVAANEPGTTIDDQDWMERNARMLITTWGNEQNCNAGRLHDYSHRTWGGLVKDYYKPRWQDFLERLINGQTPRTNHELYEMESKWVNDFSIAYPDRPSGNPVMVAHRIFSKYYGYVE